VTFEEQLKDWCRTDEGPYRRPFAPNPNWRGAQVFVVGTNPATPLHRDRFDSFDHYWAGLTVNPEIYYRVYRQQHASGSSKSSSWVRELLHDLRPLNCLVTNVAWYPASRPKYVPKPEWQFGAACLRALVEFCRPAALFCHGQPAEDFARSLGATVDRYQPAGTQTAVVDGTLVLAFHHLSGQGLRKNSKFSPATELPVFARKIKAHVRAA